MVHKKTNNMDFFERWMLWKEIILVDFKIDFHRYSQNWFLVRMCYCVWQIWCKFWVVNLFLHKIQASSDVSIFASYQFLSWILTPIVNFIQKIDPMNGSCSLKSFLPFDCWQKGGNGTTTVLQFVTKVYLMKLIFRNFDYYTKMWKFLPA